MSYADIESITSLTNPLIKGIARLHEAKERRQKKLCIIEGTRAIKTGLTRLKLHKIVCTAAGLDEALQLTNVRNIVCVSSDVMKKISTATTPSGILAVFGIPTPEKTLDRGLVLARVSDPGNMGTLIRTAGACGIRSIIVVEGTDPWSPKVIQASAGTIALVDIFQWDWKTLMASRKSLKLAALVPTGGSSIDSLKPSNTLLVVGNEAHGIPAEWLSQCEERITLPMPGGTESLNASIAGSIALYMTFVEKPSA